MTDDEILAAAQLANLGRLEDVTWFPNPANKYRVLTFARAILAAQLAAPVSEPVLIQGRERDGEWFDIHIKSLETYVYEGYEVRKLYAAPQGEGK